MDNENLISLRKPTVSDAPFLLDLVTESGVLEPNSCYAYLIFCRDFADTCVVAEVDGELAGLVIGYRPPNRLGTLFVWQIGVASSFQRQGIARRMLWHLASSLVPKGVKFVEATVAPSNTASLRMFESFAKSIQAPFDCQVGFRAEDFGKHNHEAEVLMRIGCLPSVFATGN